MREVSSTLCLGESALDVITLDQINKIQNLSSVEEKGKDFYDGMNRLYRSRSRGGIGKVD